MGSIVLFANAWGPRKGGINSFNADLCAGLRAIVSPNVEIVCVLLGPDVNRHEAAWRAEAHAAGIRIETLQTGADWEDPAEGQVGDLQRRNIAGLLYVGHDTLTGVWARDVARKLNKPWVVINHMAPPLYKPYKNTVGDALLPGLMKQRELFSAANYVAAVGPRLLDFARSRLPKAEADAKVFELTPGLADIGAATPPRKAFRGVTIGRIAREDDLIKQGRLAAHGFAFALRELKDELFGFDIAFSAIGLSSDEATYRLEEKTLGEEIANYAQREISFLGHKFNEEREVIYQALQGNDVFYMLSVHEGFGLVGLEAIAAGVPLVLSATSGLYDFLAERKLDHYVRPVAVDPAGYEPSVEKNVTQIAATTRALFESRADAHAAANTLRDELRRAGITWAACARQLLEGCQLSSLIADPAATPAPVVKVERRPWPWSGLDSNEEACVRQILAWLLAADKPYACIEGPLTVAKRRMIDRAAEIVSWDLSTTFRLRVERITMRSSDAIAERVSAVLAEAERERDGRNHLFIIDSGVQPGIGDTFWGALLSLPATAGAYVLLTTPHAAPMLPVSRTRRIEWMDSGDTDRRLAPKNALHASVEARATELIAATRLGLSSDELFELLALPPNSAPESVRYEILSRLADGGVPDIVLSEQRWMASAGSPLSSKPVPPALVNELSKFFGPARDHAVSAAKHHRWDLLRTLLPGALEGIAQLAAAGHVDQAFDTLTAESLFKTILYRYGRYDLLLATLRSFFADDQFETCLVRNATSAFDARVCVGQVLTNLGRVDQACRIYERLLAPDAGHAPLRPIHVRAAMATFLAGRYAQTEALLRKTVETANVSEPSLLAVAHRSLAKLYLRELRLDEAQREIAIARGLYEVADDFHGLAGLHAYATELALLRGDPDAALAEAAKGFECLERSERVRIDARDRVRLLLVRGKALLSAGRHDELAEAARQAVRAALDSRALDFIVESQILEAQAVRGTPDADANHQILGQLAAQTHRYGMLRHHAEALFAMALLEKERAGRAVWESTARRAIAAHDAVKEDKVLGLQIAAQLALA